MFAYTKYIADKIYELVNNGMQDVNQIKDNLHAFVEREFSLGATKEELSAILDQNNRAYYPTSHDIRNHMVRILATSRYACCILVTSRFVSKQPICILATKKYCFRTSFNISRQ